MIDETNRNWTGELSAFISPEIITASGDAAALRWTVKAWAIDHSFAYRAMSWRLNILEFLSGCINTS